MISTARVGRRYPLIASLMSFRVCRLTAATCSTSSCTRSRSGLAGSRDSSRAASSDLRVIIDSDWPVRSCMSRASRSRSSLAASWTTSARARRSSTVRAKCCRSPIMANPMNTTGSRLLRKSSLCWWVVALNRQ